MLSKTERALDLVANRFVGRAVDAVVLGAADLVAECLGVGLAGVFGMLAGGCLRRGGSRERTRLGLAGALVGGASDGFLGLVEGGLGGVGSELLASLGVEILACCLRHAG